MIDAEDHLAKLGFDREGRAPRPGRLPLLTLVGGQPDAGPVSAGLYTATISGESGGLLVQAFAALVTGDPSILEFTLGCRFGSCLASAATIRKGFDASDPLVESLVSATMSHLLELVALDPSSPLAEGLELVVEQRFAS